MALDATGTPTAPDNIPKYNTAVDPPSGKGFNAAMDAIQVALTARTTALDAKVDEPAAIASGEVPVWNGTSWVRSSVTRIGASSLGSGAPDAATFLRGDGAWAGAWASYTPAWTSSGTAPALGNGTLTGRYIQVGKVVVVNIYLLFGSTTTPGTGVWFFSLPVTADNAVVAHGSAILGDSGVSSYMGVARQETTTTFSIPVYAGAAGGSVSNASVGVPFTWGVADFLQATLPYQAV